MARAANVSATTRLPPENLVEENTSIHQRLATLTPTANQVLTALHEEHVQTVLSEPRNRTYHASSSQVSNKVVRGEMSDALAEALKSGKPNTTHHLSFGLCTMVRIAPEATLHADQHPESKAVARFLKETKTFALRFDNVDAKSQSAQPASGTQKRVPPPPPSASASAAAAAGGANQGGKNGVIASGGGITGHSERLLLLAAARRGSQISATIARHSLLGAIAATTTHQRAVDEYIAIITILNNANPCADACVPFFELGNTDDDLWAKADAIATRAAREEQKKAGNSKDSPAVASQEEIGALYREMAAKRADFATSHSTARHETSAFTTTSIQIYFLESHNQKGIGTTHKTR